MKVNKASKHAESGERKKEKKAGQSPSSFDLLSKIRDSYISVSRGFFHKFFFVCKVLILIISLLLAALFLSVDGVRGVFSVSTLFVPWISGLLQSVNE